MKRRLLSIAMAALVLAAGCGDDATPETPGACFGDATAYGQALDAAPGEVRLDGATPISDCFVDNQGAGEISEISRTVIETATGLNRELRDDPSSDAAVRLGYLVGAVEQGASETGGIHDDLVRRLDAAARFNEGEALGAEFDDAFAEGYRAGQASG